MNSLIIGQSATGKTSTIKKLLNSVEGKIIILDFNNQYNDFVDDKYKYFLDDVNPILGEIDLDDARAINAGYLYTSNCLHNKCEELLRETKVERKEGLIEEALERLHISWDNTEMAYAKELTKRIPIRKNKKHISIDEALETLSSFPIISLKSKSMHSDHMRAVAFSLLSRLSRTTNEPFYIVADDLTSFFNQGNVGLLLKTMKLEHVHFIVGFNKMNNIPKRLYPLMDRLYLHRFESNADLKEIKKMGIKTKSNIKKLENGEFAIIETKTKQEVSV